MAGCGADDLANEIALSLSEDADFSINLPDFTGPEYDLPVDEGGEASQPVTHVKNEDLTSRNVDGSGTFDFMMSGFNAHLKEQFDKGRITGKDYAEAFVALTNGAMGNATQFVLGRDQAYWAAVSAQIAAKMAQVQLVTARVQLAAEKTKLQMLRFDALNSKANYMLTKMRLASESMAYCTAKYNLEEMLPLQKEQLTQETAMTKERILAVKADTLNTGKQGQLLDSEIALAPKKASMLDKQIAGQENQNSLVIKQVALAQAELDQAPVRKTLLDKQVLAQDAQIDQAKAQTLQVGAQTDQIKAQTAYVGKQGSFIDKQIEQITQELLLQPYKKTLLQEQAEAARAQTADTRSDGAAVAGSVGKQKDLYNQQIKSYQRDAEMKAAKVFVDAWTVMKTIDEGLAPPNGFANTNLDQILASLRTNNGI